MGAIGSFLYNLIVTPLIYLVELVFALLYRAIANPGLAIIGVSLVVNFLCLPLYRMADRLQEEERQKQASMAKWVDHIKKHFKGDEQYVSRATSPSRPSTAPSRSCSRFPSSWRRTTTSPT